MAATMTKASDPDSIEVRVDEEQALAGWIFSAVSNAVIFDEQSVPPEGSTIRIEYDVWNPCDLL